MLTLIENGELYTPEPRGRQPILLFDDKIWRIGECDARAAAFALGVELEVIDASGCIVTPGFIDPHSHLTGGSGEEGFASRTPEIQFSEIVLWGITTVVGVLGVDATTRPPISLLAKVKGLCEEGMTAYMYTGHYGIPPATISGSIRNDLMVIAEVIGLGEVAISDHRAPQPTRGDRARPPGRVRRPRLSGEGYGQVGPPLLRQRRRPRSSKTVAPSPAPRPAPR